MTLKAQPITNSILCFISCCLFGGIALAFWMVLEVNIANKNNKEVSKDNTLRNSFIGAAGYIINVALLMCGCNNWWFD